MIVVCERCDTRFQLSDDRVPATGSRVRCSRCKHAFLVLPPTDTGDDTLHAFAEEAVKSGEPTPVGVTDDLSEPLAQEPLPAGEDESEWQFAEASRPEPSRPVIQDSVADPWEAVLDDEKPPEARELDDLGSPESWSFVSEDAPPLRPQRTEARAETAPAGQAPSRTPLARVALTRVRAPELRPAETVTESPPPNSNGALERVGWALTGLLLLAIVHGIDWTGAAVAAPPRRLPLGAGLVAEDVIWRRFENLVSGPVLVIAGAIVNPGSSTAGGPAHLAVRVFGEREAMEAEAMTPRPIEVLRESPPDAPEGSASLLLVGPLAPGDRVPFEAVISAPPAEDARLELRLEPLAEGAPTRSDPSPPALLPSSG